MTRGRAVGEGVGSHARGVDQVGNARGGGRLEDPARPVEVRAHQQVEAPVGTDHPGQVHHGVRAGESPLERRGRGVLRDVRAMPLDTVVGLAAAVGPAA